jgi:hypothetical protein
MATLFPLPEHEFDDCPDEGECAICCGPLTTTPRNAMLLYVGAQQWADEFRFLIDDEDIEWLIETTLPPVCRGVDEVWLERFTQCFDRIAETFATGCLPAPECTGDEMALHLVLSWAAGHVAGHPDENAAWRLGTGEFASLPTSADDGDFSLLLDCLFEDHDVLMLFDARLGGIEGDDGAIESMGLCNLHPRQWFLPFR